jgi:hypothetical protein
MENLAFGSYIQGFFAQTLFRSDSMTGRLATRTARNRGLDAIGCQHPASDAVCFVTEPPAQRQS